MEIEFDTTKRDSNIAKHGVDLVLAAQLDWDTALTLEDEKASYGERRFVTVGYIADRLHVLVWTPRGGKLRVISLRKANRREVRRYEET